GLPLKSMVSRIYSRELSLARAGLCIAGIVATVQPRPRLAAMDPIDFQVGLPNHQALPAPSSRQEQAAVDP
ncbi:hypothetical protein P7K49_010913, partial [Saguinus oedipus]